MLKQTAACGSAPAPQPRPVVSRSAVPAPAYDEHAEPAEAVLALVPQTADTLTVTDWDRIRQQLGQPDLTSESLMTDRSEFWHRTETESAALTQGMLREEDSTYGLDYGFTSDDVDWEAHWTGPDGPGFVLALRPGLDLAGVQLAIRQGAGPLAGARLQEAGRLVVRGTSDVDVWASEPMWAPLVDEPAAATYLRRGCIPLDDALGPDASDEDRQKLLAKHPVQLTLHDLAGFTIAFGDHLATVHLPEEQGDLFERLHLAEDWPGADFSNAWRTPVGDPSTGRIGYRLPEPPRAAGEALVGELPFGVCADAG